MPGTPLALLLTLPAAHAADVDGWTPGSSLAGGTGTPQGEVPQLGPEGASGALLAGFAQDPAIRRSTADVPPREVVAALLPVVAHGAWTWEDRARFDLFLPTYAHVDAPVNRYGAAALGDLRLQAVIPLSEGRGWSVGLLPRIELPTGTRDAVTRRGLSGGGALLLGGEVDGYGWVANLGLTGSGREDFEGVALGSTADAVTGGWWRATDTFRAGAELDLHLGLVRGPDGANHTSTATAFAQQVLTDGWSMSVGAGTGVIGGVGAPAYRVMAGLSYGARSPDADGDGLIGEADACPSLAEDPDGRADHDGCPDDDDDEDGVVDADDRCPDAREDADGHDDGDGCPDDDDDGDGFADADDACPREPGTAGGCPDGDGDGLTDLRDACPAEAGPADERPDEADGCPKGVYLTEAGIAHTVPVQFLDRGTRLDPETTHVLDAVLGLLLSHPELGVIEVQAHVDDKGNARADMALTQRQAEAVVAYLVQRGAAKSGLVARGIGHDQPVDTNRTLVGRARNQRVVFALAPVDEGVLETLSAARGAPPVPEPVQEEPQDLSPEPDPVAPAPAPRAPVIDVRAPEPEPTKRPPRSSDKR